MKRSKHSLFVFPPKKTLIWRRHCSIGQSCCSMTPKAKYRLISRKLLGMKFFSPERSLNQPKATGVCVRSINQSNRSISVRLFFLLCSRVFISRSYENRCNKSFGDRPVRDTKKQPWPPYFKVIHVFKICLVFSLFGSLSPGKTYFVQNMNFKISSTCGEQDNQKVEYQWQDCQCKNIQHPKRWF